MVSKSRVFLSYSHKDRVIAGSIKTTLGSCARVCRKRTAITNSDMPPDLFDPCCVCGGIILSFLPFLRARVVWELFCGVFLCLDGVNGVFLGSTATKTAGYWWVSCKKKGENKLLAKGFSTALLEHNCIRCRHNIEIHLLCFLCLSSKFPNQTVYLRRSLLRMPRLFQNYGMLRV